MLHTLFPLPWLTRAEVGSRRFLQVSRCLWVSAAAFPSFPTITSVIILILLQGLSALTDSLPELKLSQVKPLNILFRAELFLLQLLFNSRLQSWDLLRQGSSSSREGAWVTILMVRKRPLRRVSLWWIKRSKEDGLDCPLDVPVLLHWLR